MATENEALKQDLDRVREDLIQQMKKAKLYEQEATTSEAKLRRAESMQQTMLDEQITPYGVTFKNSSVPRCGRSKSMTPWELKGISSPTPQEMTPENDKDNPDQREFVLKMSQDSAERQRRGTTGTQEEMLRILPEDPEEDKRDQSGSESRGSGPVTPDNGKSSSQFFEFRRRYAAVDTELCGTEPVWRRRAIGRKVQAQQRHSRLRFRLGLQGLPRRDAVCFGIKTGL